MNNKIILYTDGACRGNGAENNIGAWAYCLRFGDTAKKDSGVVRNTTNNIMELTAAIRGLQAIKNKTAYPIEVYSDSMYVVAGAYTWYKGWEQKNWHKVKNVELWKELIALKNQCTKIVFCHVDGHSGVAGNELVDSLCNEAMDKMGGLNA